MINFFKKIFAKGKKSLRICHPEFDSGSYHQQKCSANCSQKSNVGVETPTYNNILLNTKERSVIVSCLRHHSPRRIAFTLAEVLITLGVIGVVAALTLPTLMQNYQKHVAVNKLKVNFNIMSNVIRRAEADYGDITSWDEVINSFNNKDYSDANKANAKTQAGAIVKKYILPYLSGAQFTETLSLSDLGYKRNIVYKNGNIFAPTSAAGPILRLKNGTVILVGITSSDADADGKKNLLGMTFNMDIDGPNGKNIIGKDVFIATVTYTRNTKFMFYQDYQIHTTNQILELTSTRSSLLANCKKFGTMCGALIQSDGWQIKDDYPW